jgi:hypothetical protein
MQRTFSTRKSSKPDFHAKSQTGVGITRIKIYDNVYDNFFSAKKHPFHQIFQRNKRKTKLNLDMFLNWLITLRLWWLKRHFHVENVLHSQPKITVQHFFERICAVCLFHNTSFFESSFRRTLHREFSCKMTISTLWWFHSYIFPCMVFCLFHQRLT